MLQKFAQFWGKGSAQFDPSAGARLREAELGSVQEIARQGWERCLADAKVGGSAVQRVTNYRMS